MTVERLIEELQKYPKDYEVIIHEYDIAYGEYQPTEIQNIHKEDNEDTIAITCF